MHTSFEEQVLGDLTARHEITRDQYLIARTEADEKGVAALAVLRNSGFVDHSTISECAERIAGVLSISLEALLVDAKALEFITAEMASRYQVFPVFYHLDSNTLQIAVNDPTDVMLRDVLNSYLCKRCKITLCHAFESEIERAIDSYYGLDLSLDSVISELSRQQAQKSGSHNETAAITGREHPIVRLTNGLIMQAYQRRASDIHFEPEKTFFRVRFRIDGLLTTICSLHVTHWPACSTRLKVMAGLNIAETRDAQDGGFSMRVGGAVLDLRMSVFPAIHGESIVIRLLDSSAACLSLQDTGLDAETCKKIHLASTQTQGLLLMVGPTGCGKTTTLYALLHHLSGESVNIVTLEDPVEYQLPMVRQCSVGTSGKFGFVSGLRSILRQDPDIILVGEIRDTETAELSIRAAMTGHLVLSTLHTRSALGSIQRLIDLGIDSSTVFETITAVVSQRLVRLLCTTCHAGNRQSCQSCSGTGYASRQAIAEVLVLDDECRELIQQSTSITETARRLEQAGFQSLRAAGLRLVEQGLTSMTEIDRVLGVDPQTLTDTVLTDADIETDLSEGLLSEQSRDQTQSESQRLTAVSHVRKVASVDEPPEAQGPTKSTRQTRRIELAELSDLTGHKKLERLENTVVSEQLPRRF